MDNLLWSIFGAVLSTLLGFLVQRREIGRKRLVYKEEKRQILIKNTWNKTLSEKDFSKNDPLTIRCLSNSDIKKLNKIFETKKDNLQGFRFDKTEKGVLHFQYWSANEMLILQSQNDICLQEDSRTVTGTIIDGEILPYYFVKNEYRRKYNYMRIVVSFALMLSIILLSFGIMVDAVTVIASALSMFSLVMILFYKKALASLM